jgi:hypothetical protein
MNRGAAGSVDTGHKISLGENPSGGREGMPFQREAEAILGDWRAVQRELELLDPRSPEAEALQAEAVRLRDAYQRIIRMQRETGGSDLPPFPEPSPST